MRAVVQRVTRGSVASEGVLCGKIGKGYVILLGVGHEDSEKDVDYLADKIAGLRIFPDAEDKMNLSLVDVGGEALVVSQFTLYADCRKGRRPSFTDSASPDMAEKLYEVFVEKLRSFGIKVETGVFQTHMDVEIINDGPVTIMLDSKKQF